MDFEVENRENSIKNSFEKSCFFRRRFLMDFGWILEGFGPGFGRLWGFKTEPKSVHKVPQKFFGILKGLGRVLGGFGEGFGRGLGGFWEGLGGSGGPFGRSGGLSALFCVFFVIFPCFGVFFVILF